MRFIGLSLLLLIIFYIPVSGQQTITGTLVHDGIQRDYRLYIPSSYVAGTPVPLVFNLHGFGSNAFEQQVYSGMDVQAEANGFLVCYANGVGEAWNVEWAFGSTADDVGFISQLIDELAAAYSINLSRVYSCGMSNGGFMSYRLACELNDKIAAIASVTGSMTPGYVCQPGQPVPVLEIHGTADAVVPYNGQPGLSVNIDQVIQFWATQNNCETSPDTTQIPNINTSDQSTASRIDYDDCENSKVSLIKIQGGGHTWPGASILVGVTNQDFKASEVIWEFFSQFELGGVISSVTVKDAGQEFVVSPNPASELLNLDLSRMTGNTADLPYTISNQLGQIMLQGKLNASVPSIPVGLLGHGLYYLTLRQNGQRFTKVFVKQ